MVTLLTLAGGFTAITITTYQTNKEHLIRDITAEAQLLALYSRGPLAFDLPQELQKILATTTITYPHSVAVFNADLALAASNDSGGGVITVKDSATPTGVTWQGEWLAVNLQIKDVDDELLGYIFLRVSTNPFYNQLGKFTLSMILISLVSLFFCFLLATKLQSYVSKPIVDLETISREVSEKKNFSIRAQQQSNDEIGSLTRSFNTMLEEIEKHQNERDRAENALKLNKKQLEKAVSELKFHANYDSLTLLPNRAVCMDRIQSAIIRADRRENKAVVMFLDLDHFKDVNDSLGHAVGDKLLKATSQRLLKVIRQDDTLARLGGDEFVVVLNEVDNNSDVISIAEKIMNCFSTTFELDEFKVNTAASLGICFYPDDGKTVDELMKAADTAMYRSKESGRAMFHFYEKEMNTIAYRRHEIANALRSAVEAKELRLVYQPQVRLSDNLVIGVEALLRWEHPVLGPVSPAEFIPIAENTGLIFPISDWVFKEACRQAKIWQKKGYKPFTVSVNLSPLQFRRADLPEWIQGILQQNDLATDWVGIEVTESMVMRNVDQSIQMLEQLKDMGIKISIDDFGTGYSSLNYLRKFPLDALKIDRSFVDDLVLDKDDTAITAAIISMAKNLNLKVIAEGVETERQREFLAQNDCNSMQGYLISPGVLPHDLEALMDKEGNLTNLDKSIKVQSM